MDKGRIRWIEMNRRRLEGAIRIRSLNFSYQGMKINGIKNEHIEWK